MQPKLCALTGANGFVGTCLARRLRSEGWEVVPWVRRPELGAEAVPFLLGQEVDPALFKGVQALVHCAYDFAPLRWSDIRAVNCLGSQKLLEAARRAGVEKTAVISTISAFAGCRSLYGRAKLEIESHAVAAGALVIRPGLVYGDQSGGMFGRLAKQVQASRVIPVLSGGRQTQYLVHEEDLGNLLLGALTGLVPPGTVPICAAHAHGWELREILERIATVLGKRASFVPVPWQCLWLALKSLELAHMPAAFRSDSLISMIYQDPNPSFDLMATLGFRCRPFDVTAAMLGGEARRG